MGHMVLSVHCVNRQYQIVFKSVCLGQICMLDPLLIGFVTLDQVICDFGLSSSVSLSVKWA